MKTEEEIIFNNTLKYLTATARKKYGNGEALRFYVDYIQPIKKYFEVNSEKERKRELYKQRKL